MREPKPETEVRAARLMAARRMMKRMALLALVAAIIAVVLVARGSESPSIHILIATAIGVGGTVLMGTALMTLTFFSSSSGHDAEAGEKLHESDDDQ
ncbi:hypothetical protein [Sphingomicrobium clamense]|uniref:Uncharacterized protein n=1 Tax=Sphingomicrobium clamense TaxID=2851013 RepID=A0ABS6V423_9SPHN|nr:hypothetical protein [Sphingomicrobium sp. B8]MBW0143828.1 hypothetical protein [Sphingomicrobium sp. B8]